MLRRPNYCEECDIRFRGSVCPKCNKLSEGRRRVMREIGAMQCVYAPPDVLGIEARRSDSDEEERSKYETAIYFRSFGLKKKDESCEDKKEIKKRKK